MHQPHWNSIGDFAAKKNGGHVGDHHAQRGACHHCIKRIELSRECDRRNLRFVAHFGQKKRHYRGAEHAIARAIGACRILLVQFVWHQCPRGHSYKPETKHPAQHVRADACHDPRSQRASACVVEQRRDEDTGDDGPRLAKLCSEDEGKQLCFVADFSEGNYAGRNEEGFHETNSHSAPEKYR